MISSFHLGIPATICQPVNFILFLGYPPRFHIAVLLDY